MAFFCGKICPPKSRYCQNRILHISKISFYFVFRWYSRSSQCRLVLNLFKFLWWSLKKHGKCNWETAKIGIRTPLKLYVYFHSSLTRKRRASSRPHFRTVRKVLWKMVKNCVRNRSTPDEIDTETEICTSLKSEFYFRFHWPTSTKSTLISYISF